jgi:hypothetical protein
VALGTEELRRLRAQGICGVDAQANNGANGLDCFRSMGCAYFSKASRGIWMERQRSNAAFRAAAERVK